MGDQNVCVTCKTCRDAAHVDGPATNHACVHTTFRNNARVLVALAVPQSQKICLVPPDIFRTPHQATPRTAVVGACGSPDDDDVGGADNTSPSCGELSGTGGGDVVAPKRPSIHSGFPMASDAWAASAATSTPLCTTKYIPPNLRTAEQTRV